MVKSGCSLSERLVTEVQEAAHTFAGSKGEGGEGPGEGGGGGGGEGGEGGGGGRGREGERVKEQRLLATPRARLGTKARERLLWRHQDYGNRSHHSN